MTSANRIIDIGLDERTIIRRSEEVEQERQVAIRDLLHANSFAPAGLEGPFRIFLRVEDNRIVIDIKDADDRPLDTVRLGLARLRRPIRDYFAICDSYFRAVKAGAPHQIEPIDMARRGLHNQAAELLIECLDGKIALDFDTARRLFTLICVLHIR